MPIIKKMRVIITFLILFLSLTVFSQDFLDKKVINIDYSNDISKLYEVGLNQTDISFLGYLLIENINKTIQIDSLTIKGYIEKLKIYRLTDEYKMMIEIRNEIKKSANTNQSFPDSLEIMTDFDLALKKSIQLDKPLLVIFVGRMSPDSDVYKKEILIGTLTKYIKNYVVTWLIIDGNDEKSKKNFKIEKEKFKTDFCPFSVLVKNGEIIRSFNGFSKRRLSEYIEFLNNK